MITFFLSFRHLLNTMFSVVLLIFLFYAWLLRLCSIMFFITAFLVVSFLFFSSSLSNVKFKMTIENQIVFRVLISHLFHFRPHILTLEEFTESWLKFSHSEKVTIQQAESQSLGTFISRLCRIIPAHCIYYKGKYRLGILLIS